MENRILKLYMMIGIPGSGKSTWIKNQDWNTNTVLISSDKLIDEYAISVNKTYNEVFDEYVGIATSKIFELANNAKKDGKDVVWDQTNVSVKSRKKKLDLFPDYHKIAVYFNTPDDNELEKRLKSRPGKHISQRVIYQMKDSLVIPTIDEGFDEIWYENGGL